MKYHGELKMPIYRVHFSGSRPPPLSLSFFTKWYRQQNILQKFVRNPVIQLPSGRWGCWERTAFMLSDRISVSAPTICLDSIPRVIWIQRHL